MKVLRNRKTQNKAIKITEAMLKRLILQEMKGLTGKIVDVESVKAREIEADEYADTLEKDIDIYKALQIKENRIKRQQVALARRAKRISEAKKATKK